MSNKIVVIGAGVAGLTSAFLLSKSKANIITVVAKHMPGDYDIEYASPWAGANVLPMALEADSRWERRTWKELRRLVLEVPEAGIHFQKANIYRREQDIVSEPTGAFYDGLFAPDPWYKAMFDDYRDFAPEELPEGFFSGSQFGSVCINVAVYLPWLLGQCLKNGVVFKRATLSHIHEARNLSHTGLPADFVVNCTGLGARKLGGVEDEAMVPARGQIVVVRNEATPMIATSGNDDAPYDVCYLMMRAAGGGTILGGTYDKGNWDGNPDANVALRIMKRCVEVCPALTGGKGIAGLDVIRHGVGLRPLRTKGVRVELDREVMGESGTVVVHNYGHSGWGYQGSYGCAEGVVEIVNTVRKEKGEDLSSEPKLFTWDD